MFFPFSLSVSLNLLDLHVAIDRLRARVLISRLLPRHFSLVDLSLASTSGIWTFHFRSGFLVIFTIFMTIDTVQDSFLGIFSLVVYTMDIRLALFPK